MSAETNAPLSQTVAHKGDEAENPTDNPDSRVAWKARALAAEAELASEREFLGSQIRAQKAELAALKSDAERYRWLRTQSSGIRRSHAWASSPEIFDADIDEAKAYDDAARTQGGG